MKIQRNTEKILLTEVKNISSLSYKNKQNEYKFYSIFPLKHPRKICIHFSLNALNTLSDIENSAPRRKENTIVKLCR